MIYREQGFLAMLDMAPSPPLPSVGSRIDRRHRGILRKRDNLLTVEGERGLGRSQIIRRQESLVLYKSFNTICTKHFSRVSEANDLYRYYQNVCTPGELNNKNL